MAYYRTGSGSGALTVKEFNDTTSYALSGNSYPYTVASWTFPKGAVFFGAEITRDSISLGGASGTPNCNFQDENGNVLTNTALPVRSSTTTYTHTATLSFSKINTLNLVRTTSNPITSSESYITVKLYYATVE